MFVARIHNNSLGACIPVDSEEEGIALIKELIKEQFPKVDVDSLEDDIGNNLEWRSSDYDETADFSNEFTFSLGKLDYE